MYIYICTGVGKRGIQCLEYGSVGSEIFWIPDSESVFEIWETRNHKIIDLIEKKGTELGTFKWDILNPNRLINLEINNNGRTSHI